MAGGGRHITIVHLMVEEPLRSVTIQPVGRPDLRRITTCISPTIITAWYCGVN